MEIVPVSKIRFARPAESERRGDRAAEEPARSVVRDGLPAMRIAGTSSFELESAEETPEESVVPREEEPWS